MFFFFILRGFILCGKRGFHLTSPRFTSPILFFPCSFFHLHAARLRAGFTLPFRSGLFRLHAACFRRVFPFPSVQGSSACTPRVSGGFSLFPSVRGASAFHTLPAGDPFAVPSRLCVSYHMPRPVGIPPVSIVIFGARFDRRGVLLCGGGRENAPARAARGDDEGGARE